MYIVSTNLAEQGTSSGSSQSNSLDVILEGNSGRRPGKETEALKAPQRRPQSKQRTQTIGAASASPQPESPCAPRNRPIKRRERKSEGSRMWLRAYSRSSGGEHAEGTKHVRNSGRNPTVIRMKRVYRDRECTED